MRALPAELDDRDIATSLRDDWKIETASLEYAPIGGGSYHWIVTGQDGTRFFATADDLDRKPWLGTTRDSAFSGLRQAFDAAAALHDDGLEFVLAPARSSAGATLTRLTSRYSLSLFPFVMGESGTYGRYGDEERTAILEMLGRLHRATANVRAFEVELPGRAALEEALAALDEPWTGGPFAEPARTALAAHEQDIELMLARYELLASELPPRSEWVVTHGEPHAGNVIRTAESYVLVDWDTIALAPAERDHWMLAGTSGFSSLRWDLADLASFTAFLRAPHVENADTQKAHQGVTTILGRYS